MQLVFVGVALTSYVLDNSPFRLANAGVNALFATQSNDFAVHARKFLPTPQLGVPLLKALPNLPTTQYLFLIAPVQLVLINPIGYVMMDLSSIKQPSIQADSSTSPPPPLVVRLLKTVVRVLISPVVLMSALGVVANFALRRTLPLPVEATLTTLGQSFSALALFNLGLSLSPPPPPPSDATATVSAASSAARTF